MTTPIPPTLFREAILGLLDECFDNVHGAFLDKGTSLFETLATISADEASRPISPRCATIAAQVKHVAFYLDVVEAYARGTLDGPVDWDAIWQSTHAVTPEEWAAIQAELRASYDRTRALVTEEANWDTDRKIGGAIATIAHTAYHLGEIRHALCVIKP
jgi:hypothetical protein